MVFYDICVARHQKIDHYVNRFPAILHTNLANQLEAPQSLTLGVAVALESADQGGVLALAKRFGIQSHIHIEGADMRHVFVGQQQPGNRPADDGELAFEAAKNLADFNQHRLHRCAGAVVVVGG